MANRDNFLRKYYMNKCKHAQKQLVHVEIE